MPAPPAGTSTTSTVRPSSNLVFFKPVYSKIKFWQMIGRGTRLCSELFGPDDDKQDFRVFDFCFNFDFFRENPQGIEVRGAVPLGTRLFRSRVQLLAHAQASPDLDSRSWTRSLRTSTLLDIRRRIEKHIKSDAFRIQCSGLHRRAGPNLREVPCEKMHIDA